MARSTLPMLVNPDAVAAEGEYGPAMRALMPRHRAFVIAMFELGDHPTNSDCARAAGYEGSTTVIATTAHRIAHHEKVQLAIKEEAERRCTTMMPLALRRLGSILLDKQHTDSLAAVKHSLAIGGISPSQQIEVTHKIDRRQAILELREIMAQMKDAGMDLTQIGEIEDAEFEEVGETEEVIGSREGLEDLL